MVAMKKVIIQLSGLAAIMTATAMLQGCAAESPFGEVGEGTLSINTEINGETHKTRAGEESGTLPNLTELQEKCVVFLENSRGVMRKYKGVANIPSRINLSTGAYVCNAWTGDSVSASFDSKFYRGQQDFQITEGGNTSLTVKCNIANVVVSVDGASVTDTGLKDSKITFSTPRGSLEFDETMFDNKKGYFMTPSPETKDKDPEKYAANTTVTVKIEGTTADGKAYSKESKIENVQRAHEYQVQLTADKPTIGEGGALIQIVIKDIPIIEDTIEVFPAPVVKGYGFDMADQLVNTDNTFTDQKLYICEYKGIGSANVTFSDNFNVASGNLFDNNYVTELGNNGIIVERTESKAADSGENVYEIFMTLPASFLNGLVSSPTSYIVTITATDSRNLTTTSALRIANSVEAIEKIDDVIADPAPDVNTDPMAILATSATLTGTLYNEDAARYGFKYRKSGDSTWSEALAGTSSNKPRKTRADGTTYSVTIKGLQPATTYEYKAFADDFESTNVQTFSTESKYIIPNASMEEWSTYKAKTILGITKDIIFPGTGSETTFWDSGNEGAASANKVLTDKSTDMKHSGTYSCRMASASAMGFLAAGNLFFGDYVRTDGTNGVLALGREYNGSHPTKLKVWANYRPGTVDIIKEGNESNVDFSKGEPDHGQIYVALTVGAVDIRTNPDNQKLFNKDDDQVVAYGQVTWTEAFGPDGALKEVEIPIEYKANAKTKRPTHLVITCCASKFGDFFSGSSSSVMYLDDFELVYE